MHYIKIGEGKTTILLCHGFGESAFIWDALIEKLKNDFTLIVPTLPGCLPSPLPNNLSIESMAEGMHQIILKEHVNKFYFIGHSMGGYIGLCYARLYEKFLKGLTLVNSTAFADTAEKKASRLKTNEFIANNDLSIYLKTSIPNLYGDAFKLLNAAAINNHIKQASEGITKQGLIAQNTCMIHRADSIGFLKRTHLPIQFIIGDADNIVTIEKSKEQALLPKNAQCTILAKIGHMSLIETDISEHIKTFAV